MDTFFQEMLGGVGRLQENVGVTLFHQWRSGYPRNEANVKREGVRQSGRKSTKSAEVSLRGQERRRRVLFFFFLAR